MRSCGTRSELAAVEDGLPYRAMPLRELARRIAESSDLIALRELHDHRRPFRLRDGKPLRLAELLGELRRRQLARKDLNDRPGVLERAYDLTIDKFSRLPATDPECGRVKSRAPDCRYYYRPFLALLAKRAADRPPETALEEDEMAARLLQRLVERHYRLSCLEARRSANPARSRYAWKVAGGTLTVSMPNYLPGRQRRRWLEGNVLDPDPERPGEQDRIQEIVDRRLGVPRRVRFGEEWAVGDPAALPDEDAGAGIQEDVSMRGLADVVAEEKAETIDRQRPSVRRLGPGRLAELVRRVFSDLSEGTYEEKALAEEFGLSRPTFSRFAGSRWEPGNGRTPDLWRNLAHTLARHAPFIAATKEAGVWARVEAVLRETEKGDA